MSYPIYPTWNDQANADLAAERAADERLSTVERVEDFLAQIEPAELVAQALNVVGEAGEFAEAYRRYIGAARRPGSIEEVAAELADVIISAQVMAVRLGLDPDEIVADKWAVIMTRGFGNQARDEAGL